MSDSDHERNEKDSIRLLNPTFAKIIRWIWFDGHNFVIPGPTTSNSIVIHIDAPEDWSYWTSRSKTFLLCRVHHSHSIRRRNDRNARWALHSRQMWRWNPFGRRPELLGRDGLLLWWKAWSLLRKGSDMVLLRCKYWMMMMWSGEMMYAAAKRRCGWRWCIIIFSCGVMGDTSTWKKKRIRGEDESSLCRFLFYSKKIYVHTICSR